MLKNLCIWEARCHVVLKLLIVANTRSIELARQSVHVKDSGKCVGESGGQSPPEAESFLTFGRPTTAAEFAVLTISCEVRICDVSTKLNILPCNPPLRIGMTIAIGWAACC